MSQTNEHKSKKGGTKVGAVIILIISAIVFLPAGGAAVYQGLLNKNKEPVFGSYKNHKITYTEVRKSAEQLVRAYNIQVNDQNHYRVFYTAFNQTLTGMVYGDAIKKSGYKVPESAVNRAILPAFYDENGVFSQKLYNQAKTSDINEYRSSVEKDLIAATYVGDLLGSSTASFNGKALYGLKTTQAEADFIAAMGTEKHSFDMAAFDTSKYPESEVVKYAKENAEDFTRYDISAISVDSESDAKSLLKQLTAGDITFEDAVSEKSAKYYSDADGKLSTAYRYQISEMVEKEEDVPEIINLAKDTLSKVIKTKHGYTIFRNDGEAVPADVTNADLISVVKNYITEQRASLIEEYYIAIAKDFASEAAVSGFKTACKRYNVTSVEVPAFPVNYGNTSFFDANPEQSELSSLKDNADLLKEAFSLKNGEVSSPMVMGSNVVVLKCTGIQNAAADSVDSINAKVASTDSASSNYQLLSSDKVKNDFFATYFSTFMNNK